MLSKIGPMLLSLTIIGCMSGRVAVNIKAKMVDANTGNIISSCSVILKRDGEKQGEYEFHGVIKKDFSYLPDIGDKPPKLIFKCQGYKDKHIHRINPERYRWKGFDEITDIGTFKFEK